MGATDDKKPDRNRTDEEEGEGLENLSVSNNIAGGKGSSHDLTV